VHQCFEHGEIHSQVLLGLRHPSLVGGNREKGDIYGVYPGQHVLDETFVAGNVYEPDLGPVVEGGPGKSEVDRQPAAFLLVPAVGVTAGQRLDER
jgi:hypothetical protein